MKIKASVKNTLATMARNVEGMLLQQSKFIQNYVKVALVGRCFKRR